MRNTKSLAWMLAIAAMRLTFPPVQFAQPDGADGKEPQKKPTVRVGAAQPRSRLINWRQTPARR